MQNTKTALLAGATGLIGSHLLTKLLEQPAYDKVKILVRKQIPLTHPKLEQIVIDYDQIEQYEEAFQADDVYCCLGTTIKKAGSREAFQKVDLEYPLAIARLAHHHGASRFLIVTAVGADEGSSFYYNRVKGSVEKEIGKIGLSAVHVFRPSLLLGKRDESRPGEQLGVLFHPLLTLFTVGKWSKHRPVQANDVTAAMYQVAQTERQGANIYEYDQIMEYRSRTS